MNPAEVLRLMLGNEPLQKRRDAIARRRILPLARCERAGNHGKKCAVDQRITVDEKQSRLFGTFHHVNIKRALLTGERLLLEASRLKPRFSAGGAR